MALKTPHKEWRIARISAIDVKAVGLEQLLTNLWLRIMLENRPWTREGPAYRTIADLANLIEHQAAGFEGFHAGGIAEAWLRADLCKVPKRKPAEFTVARPVHELAARIRNPRESGDSNASLVVYEWLRHCAPQVLAMLGDFIRIDTRSEDLDLDAFALALMGQELPPDVRKKDTPDALPAPLSVGQALIFADDIRCLLAYRSVMPRAGLVEHLRRMMGLHLGLYMLRLCRLVVEVEKSGGEMGNCPFCKGASLSEPRCRHRLSLVVDCGDEASGDMARLAEESWLTQEDYLGRYVRSHIALRKLLEFGKDMMGLEDAAPLDVIARLESTASVDRLDAYFVQRLGSLEDETGADVAARRAEYGALGRSPFRTYVDLLAHYSERRWVSYHRFLLDSLFGKNTGEGLLRQPLGGRRRRRAVLSAGILETLCTIAVVSTVGGEHVTRPVRVSELVRRLEDRYGLLITSPPEGRSDDPTVTKAFALNAERLKARLRETGMFVEVSDAFLAQTVRPRYHLGGTSA